MTKLFGIIIAAALVNNVVLVQLLGVSSLFAYSRQLRGAVELALASFLVLFLASLVNLLLYRFLLQPLGLAYLNLACFVGVSAGLTGFLVLLVKDRLSFSMRRHGLSLAMIGGNSAVIGVSLLNTLTTLNTVEAVAYCFGTALGFALLLIAFAALRLRLDLADIPLPFRGAPIYLISAGIVAMCLLGFAGPA